LVSKTAGQVLPSCVRVPPWPPAATVEAFPSPPVPAGPTTAARPVSISPRAAASNRVRPSAHQGRPRPDSSRSSQQADPTAQERTLASRPRPRPIPPLRSCWILPTPDPTPPSLSASLAGPGARRGGGGHRGSSAGRESAPPVRGHGARQGRHRHRLRYAPRPPRGGSPRPPRFLRLPPCTWSFDSGGSLA